MNITLDAIRGDIARTVSTALEEDIADGDITADLIPEGKTDRAKIITRDDCVICGCAWVEETYKQLDGRVSIQWHAKDGDNLAPNATIAELSGPSRALLTGERTGLNFLQLLSGTATKAQKFQKALGDSHIKLLDTRKTIPGLRTAQKYAVATGGCHNHRIGLFDAYLIKENHIAACGSIKNAITRAQQLHPNKPVEVEVESLDELREALCHHADIIMLDNFDDGMLAELINIEKGASKYELSGNMSLEDIGRYRDFPIDFISFGALTKHVQAVDLSFRVCSTEGV